MPAGRPRSGPSSIGRGRPWCPAGGSRPRPARSVGPCSRSPHASPRRRRLGSTARPSATPSPSTTRSTSRRRHRRPPPPPSSSSPRRRAPPTTSAPLRVQVGATVEDQEVIFETTRALEVSPARIAEVVAVDPGTDHIERAPGRVLATERPPDPVGGRPLVTAASAGSTVVQVAPAIGLEPGDQLRIQGTAYRDRVGEPGPGHARRPTGGGGSRRDAVREDRGARGVHAARPPAARLLRRPQVAAQPRASRPHRARAHPVGVGGRGWRRSICGTRSGGRRTARTSRRGTPSSSSADRPPRSPCASVGRDRSTRSRSTGGRTGGSGSSTRGRSRPSASATTVDHVRLPRAVRARRRRRRPTHADRQHDHHQRLPQRGAAGRHRAVPAVRTHACPLRHLLVRRAGGALQAGRPGRPRHPRGGRLPARAGGAGQRRSRAPRARSPTGSERTACSTRSPSRPAATCAGSVLDQPGRRRRCTRCCSTARPGCSRIRIAGRVRPLRRPRRPGPRRSALVRCLSSATVPVAWHLIPPTAAG